MFNEINNNLEKKKLTKVVFLVFLVISGVVEGNPRIGLFLNKCTTLLDTVGGTVTGRVHDRGDEVDIGTVITKKVIVRGEKVSKGEIVCLVLSCLQCLDCIGSLSSWSIIRSSVMELWPVRRWRTVRGLQCL